MPSKIQIQDSWILTAMSRKRSYFVKKKFAPVSRAGVFIRENFHPCHREPRTRIRASPASHLKSSKRLLWTRVAGWDLRNRASMVHRAYMKRPLVLGQKVAWNSHLTFVHLHSLHSPVYTFIDLQTPSHTFIYKGVWRSVKVHEGV